MEQSLIAISNRTLEPNMEKQIACRPPNPIPKTVDFSNFVMQHYLPLMKSAGTFPTYKCQYYTEINSK